MFLSLQLFHPTLQILQSKGHPASYFIGKQGVFINIYSATHGCIFHFETYNSKLETAVDTPYQDFT